MTKLDNRNQDDIVGETLSRLGRDLTAPLTALIAEIHAVDELNADDDSAAHLVELGYELRGILAPLIELARLEARLSVNQQRRADIELEGLVEETVAAPELAGTFELAVRGELGVSFADEPALSHWLTLCLRLIGRMTKDKKRLRAHREVHRPSDRIVLAVHIRDRDRISLEILKWAARLIGASVDVEGPALRLCFPVCEAPEADQTVLPAKPVGPVLAFRRTDERGEVQHDVSERRAIVLVVDHEPAAQNYMGRVLELEGFDVVTSSALEHAHEAAHAYRPDVIMLDRLQLAHEGGDWVRRFKEDPALARIPLVLVQSEESESLGLVGIADVVRKPIDPLEIVKTLDRLTRAGSPPVVVVRNEKDATKWERYLEGTLERIVVAGSVSDAERILDSATPVALIVDVRSVDGAIALLERVRSRQGGAELPVIAVHGRLTKKVRLRLESLADQRLTGSELGRRSLQSALRALIGDGERRGVGVS